MEGPAGKGPDLGSCLNILEKLEVEEQERVSQVIYVNPYKCLR